MPEIELCPYCDGACRIRSSTNPFYVDCSICSYMSGLFSTKSATIAAHNKFCIQLQRAEELEKFAELAVPIVEWMKEYFTPLDRCAGFTSNEIKDKCDTCLAASPEKPKEVSFEDVRGIFKRPENLLNPVSVCHGAPPQIYSADGGTQSYAMTGNDYICSECGQAAEFREKGGDDGIK